MKVDRVRLGEVGSVVEEEEERRGWLLVGEGRREEGREEEMKERGRLESR